MTKNNIMVTVNLEELKHHSVQHCDVIILQRYDEDSIDVYFVELKRLESPYETLPDDIQGKAIGSKQIFESEFGKMPLLAGKSIRKFFVLVIPSQAMNAIRTLIIHYLSTHRILSHPVKASYDAVFIRKSGSFISRSCHTQDIIIHDRYAH